MSEVYHAPYCTMIPEKWYYVWCVSRIELLQFKYHIGGKHLIMSDSHKRIFGCEDKDVMSEWTPNWFWKLMGYK